MPTPRLNLPTIDPNMSADVPRDLNALAQAVDAAAAKASDVGDMATVPTAAKNAAGAISELFQSGVDGKYQLETAVLAMEGMVSKAGAVATFDELDDGIRSIPVGIDTSDATATANDLRGGTTAYVNDVLVAGALPTRAGGNVVPGPADIVKAAGIYDDPITVKGVVVPAPKVLNDTTIAGTQGTMPDRGAVTLTPGAAEQIIADGYHNGLGKMLAVSGLDASKILQGHVIAGVAGTLVPGIPSASGTGGMVNSSLTVNTLNFRPKVIVVQTWNGSSPGGIYREFVYNETRFPGVGFNLDKGSVVYQEPSTFSAGNNASWTITNNGFTCAGTNADSNQCKWHAFG